MVVKTSLHRMPLKRIGVPVAIGEPEVTVVTTEQADTLSSPPSSEAYPSTPVATSATNTVTQSTTTAGPSGNETGRRVVVFAFGLIQIAIVLRLILLLADAREGNGLVSGILNISQLFVGPFEGVLRTDALAKGGSILDLAAVVALAGWSTLELIVLWALGMFKHETA